MPTPSLKRDVKDVPSTSQSRKNLADLILSKMIEGDIINFRREYPFAYKLADKYNELEFWRTLIFRQVPSLLVLKNAALSDRLEKCWIAFKKQLAAQKSIVITKSEIKYELGEKVGEDTASHKKSKPKSILDFCK